MKGTGGGGGKDCASDIVDGTEYIERFGDGRPRTPGLAGLARPGEAGVEDSPAGFGVSAFLNRLDIPDTMIPGCMPNKGESKFTVPRMRCLK